MGFSRYDLVIFVRVAVLFLCIAAACTSYFTTDLIVTPVMFGLLAVISTLELIWHLRKMERAWSRFLLSIAHHDFSRSYREYDDFRELSAAFDLITQSFEQLNTQISADYHLLKTVYQHVKIGLLCFQPSGEVTIANRSALKLLRLDHLTNINELRNGHPRLHQSLLYANEIKGEVIQDEQGNKFMMRTEPFTLKGKAYRLASIYNLTSTLELNELESYQKLLRVLTHEIMNSSTPILSLIEVVNQKLLDEDRLKSLSAKDQKNVATSLRGIQQRTSGMLSFVNAYRKVNREITVHKAQVSFGAFKSSLEGQLAGLWQAYPDTALEVRGSQLTSLYIDPDLITQVLINLVKNALEASVDQPRPRVVLDFNPDGDALVIAVADNGAGVSEDVKQDIFVPFFTTKKEGSGVGLALSRKIVRAHHGQLTFERKDGFTRFEIRLADALRLPSTS